MLDALRRSLDLDVQQRAGCSKGLGQGCVQAWSERSPWECGARKNGERAGVEILGGGKFLTEAMGRGEQLLPTPRRWKPGCLWGLGKRTASGI